MIDTKIILIILAIMIATTIIIFLVIPIEEVKGQVFLQEDQAMICLSTVWTDVSNDIVCKVFNSDDIDGLSMHSIYSDIMQEKDTFDLPLATK